MKASVCHVTFLSVFKKLDVKAEYIRFFSLLLLSAIAAPDWWEPLNKSCWGDPPTRSSSGGRTHRPTDPHTHRPTRMALLRSALLLYVCVEASGET